jgi:adenylylsulfate kinase
MTVFQQLLNCSFPSPVYCILCILSVESSVGVCYPFINRASSNGLSEVSLEKFLTPHQGTIKKENRQKLNSHKSAIVWFTGLPCSGKSTLAHTLEERLFGRKVRTFVIDGDNVRTGLNKDLGFSAEDRKENIRRIGEVAKLFVEAGMIVMTAFISPYRKDREFVRSLVNTDEFIEVYVKCPLRICEERDVKGHYRMARQGIIRQFTGIDDPYEEPEHPERVIETDRLTVDEGVEEIMGYLEEKKFFFDREENGSPRTA